MKKLDNPEFGYLCAAITLLTWAAFPVVSRIAGTSSLTLFDTLALRLGTASLALAYWWVPRLLSPQRRALPFKQVLAFSAVAGLAYPLVAYTAMVFAPAIHGAVFLSGLLPVLTAMLAFVFWRELPSRLGYWSLGLVFAGVLLLFVSSVLQTGVTLRALGGDAILVLASATWALFTVMLKHYKAKAFDVTLASVAVASLVYIPIYAWVLPSNLAQAPWTEVLFQASFQGFLLPVVAMFTYAKAVELLGATKTVTLLAATPVVGTLMAVGFLGEHLYPGAAVGSVLVFVGSAMGAMLQGNPQRGGSTR